MPSRVFVAATAVVAAIGGSVMAGVLPSGAQVSETADRLERRQLTPELPAPTIPVDGDCESWKPLLAKYGIPYDEARPRMVRESNCSNARNYSPASRDDSYGVLQVNRWGSAMARWWNSGGFTAEVMATPEGAVAAAAVLFHHVCGWSSWTPPYSCNDRFPATPIPAWGAT